MATLPRTDVDPITLAVVAGSLKSTVRQMTLTMERTARSPVFKLVRDYSNAIFDGEARMVVQGEDLPIHLGSLMYATKAVVEYFAGDVAPGDVFFHNDPATGGSHLQDQCMFKPVFCDGELLFWVANKAHMDDTGGNVPGGYNPRAEELYAEGLRITPLRVYAAGSPLRDVIEFVIGNVRTGEQQRHDMGAQLAALRIAERNLVSLVENYGVARVTACLDRILSIGEENMRAAISSFPDGVYEGSSPVEDDGRSGELRIDCRLEVEQDELKVTISSPPQTRSYINSYWANTISSIYYGVLMYARVPPPYNEGLYRPVSFDLGEVGSLTNARYPAPCSAATSTVGDNITDAVRDAFSKALPDRAVAGWAHAAGTNQLGTDPRSGDFYNFNMIIGTSGGAGATYGFDGWHCLNIIGGGGGIVTGDVELLEHEYPVTIQRYELRTDSGGAGRWRGGLGPVFEEEPVEHEAELVLWGEGFRYPAAGVLGASSALGDRKVAQKFLIDEGATEILKSNSVYRIRPGRMLRTCPPGGGGVGDPFDREVAAVLVDVREGYVSVEGARLEYGVVLTPGTLEVDEVATAAIRNGRR